jgi:dihydroorotate dehydrogenase
MSLYSALLRPLLFKVDPERAHRAAIALGSRMSRSAVGRAIARTWNVQFEALCVSAMGLRFQNPIGLAAGFDKGGRLYAVMADLGFGHMEIGSISSRPWPGNPSPTLLRLPRDWGLINRPGLNSEGADVVFERLRTAKFDIPVGINLVKTADPKISGEAAVRDYLDALVRFYPRADFITLNLSCPNTAEGRTFEDPELLGQFLEGIQQLEGTLTAHGRKPMLIKLSPDLEDSILDEILSLARTFGISGCVIGNTTTRRETLTTPKQVLDQFGYGGVSGRPLKPYIREMVEKVVARTPRDFVVIAAGGVGCDPGKHPAQEVWEYLELGASLVQVHTGLIYRGPGLAGTTNRGLMQILRRSPYRTLQEFIDRRQAQRPVPAPANGRAGNQGGGHHQSSSPALKTGTRPHLVER